MEPDLKTLCSMIEGAPETKANVHEVYAALRPRGPYRVQHPSLGPVWLVTSFEDVKTIVNETGVFVTSTNSELLKKRNGPMRTYIPDWSDDPLIIQDPPKHSRIRRIGATAFSTRQLEAFAPRLREIARDTITPYANAVEFDFITEIAEPYCANAVAEYTGLSQISLRIMLRWFGNFGLLRGHHDSAIPGRQQYLEAQLAATPDPERFNLVTIIARAVSDQELSMAEGQGLLMSIVIAGIEATTPALCNAVLTVVSQPEGLDMIRRASVDLTNLVDEALRYEGPAETLLPRWATTDFKLSGASIEEGDLVYPVLSAANRDPAQYDEPTTFCPAREDIDNLIFGGGIHFCLGVPLGRMMVETLLVEIAKQFVSLRYSGLPEEVSWAADTAVRRLAGLPLAQS